MHVMPLIHLNIKYIIVELRKMQAGKQRAQQHQIFVLEGFRAGRVTYDPPERLFWLQVVSRKNCRRHITKIFHIRCFHTSWYRYLLKIIHNIWNLGDLFNLNLRTYY